MITKFTCGNFFSPFADVKFRIFTYIGKVEEYPTRIILVKNCVKNMFQTNTFNRASNDKYYLINSNGTIKLINVIIKIVSSI